MMILSFKAAGDFPAAFAPFATSREPSMTLKDGCHAQDIIHAGGGYVSATVWVGGKDERNRGRPEWMRVPLALLPDEWFREMKADAEEALRLAA
jgi:hypothetical protein